MDSERLIGFFSEGEGWEERKVFKEDWMIPRRIKWSVAEVKSDSKE